MACALHDREGCAQPPGELSCQLRTAEGCSVRRGRHPSRQLRRVLQGEVRRSPGSTREPSRGLSVALGRAVRPLAGGVDTPMGSRALPFAESSGAPCGAVDSSPELGDSRCPRCPVSLRELSRPLRGAVDTPLGSRLRHASPRAPSPRRGLSRLGIERREPLPQLLQPLGAEAEDHVPALQADARPVDARRSRAEWRPETRASPRAPAGPARDCLRRCAETASEG